VAFACFGVLVVHYEWSREDPFLLAMGRLGGEALGRPKFWVNKNPTQIRSGQRCGHGAALFRPAWQHAIVDHTNLDRIQVILFDSPCAVNLSVQLPIQTNKLFTN